jgi:hypothetical protein
MAEESLLPVYTAFGGIVLGAVASFVPAYILERIKRKDEVLAVTGAIVTEIRTTLFLVKKRRYIESIEATLKAIRDKRIPTSSFQIMVPEDYCPIYKSHVEKVGLIPSAYRDDVVAFYQLLEGAICDVRPGGLIASNQCGEVEFAELLEIAAEAVRIGNRILSNYPREKE